MHIILDTCKLKIERLRYSGGGITRHLLGQLGVGLMLKQLEIVHIVHSKT